MTMRDVYKATCEPGTVLYTGKTMDKLDGSVDNRVGYLRIISQPLNLPILTKRTVLPKGRCGYVLSYKFWYP